MNTQWYERFNTQYDVARSVGVEFGHKVLCEYCAQLAHSKSYDSLGTSKQATIRRAAEIDTSHIFFSSTAARRTNSCERSYKTTSRRVVTNTLRTALKLCYFWTDTRSQSQRMEDRMGQHSPRRQGKQKRTMQRRHQMTQKAESRNSIKNTSRTSLVSNVGKRAIHSPIAHQRTTMMIIHPSQASPEGAAILGGSQKSKTLKISSTA